MHTVSLLTSTLYPHFLALPCDWIYRLWGCPRRPAGAAHKWSQSCMAYMVSMWKCCFFAACVNDCVSISIYLINWCANRNQMSHVSFCLAKGYITPEKKTGLQIKVQFLFISLTYSKFFLQYNLHVGTTYFTNVQFDAGCQMNIPMSSLILLRNRTLPVPQSCPFAPTSAIIPTRKRKPLVSILTS